MRFAPCTVALLLPFATALIPTPAAAEVRVPALVGSHMVLQADEPARVWGWADPGETVQVAAAEAAAETTADGDGRWAVDLAPRPAGGPFTLTVAGENTLRFEDVEATLTGDDGLPASPFRTDDWPAVTAPKERTDGRALVRAMHARYDGRWYKDFMLVQDVTYFRDGNEDRTEQMAEYISLPGRVRAITGDIADGNAEIYVDGAFHRFEAGRPAGRVPAVHGVLLLGFDVYAQSPETSIDQLEALGIDLDRITEAPWRGREGWLVGAAPGDPSTPQFWVEKDRLLCGRVLSQRPYGTLDVEMGGWEPLGDGWIATELVFKRNGVLALKERYVEFRTVEAIDPAFFDVANLKVTGPLP